MDRSRAEYGRRVGARTTATFREPVGVAAAVPVPAAPFPAPKFGSGTGFIAQGRVEVDFSSTPPLSSSFELDVRVADRLLPS